MSIVRLQICKVFEDLDHLLFDSGIYLSPSPMDGMWVQFWSETLKVRRIVTHRQGKLHGLQGLYNMSGHPAVIQHFRDGRLFGETLLYPSTAMTKNHLLYDGKASTGIPFTARSAVGYEGFLFTKHEKDLPVELYRLFTRHLHT